MQEEEIKEQLAVGREYLDVHFLKRHVPLRWVLVVFLGVVILFSLFFWVLGKSLTNTVVLAEEGEGSTEFTFGSWPALEEGPFFREVKERMIEDKQDFIEGDLSAMVLKVYKEGKPVYEAKILSKGREGSWWETPAGLYRVEGKERVHFSSIGEVNMPWSLPFQGNFFIHGWPYYPNGDPVSPGYSGGCIRLGNEDAERIFSLASTGMPVLVFEGDFESDGFSYQPREPEVKAEAYLAADLKSNFVFAEKGRQVVRPMASLTKLMTGLVATEYMNIEKEIFITPSMLVSTSKPRLRAGESVSVFDLLHLLLQESSNEAAAALAEGYYGGRKTFLDLMNRKAEAIGMRHTHFEDPAGSGAGNTSTPEDLFVLARHLYNNRRFILNISRNHLDNRAYGDSSFNDLGNFNIFTGQEDFVGGKTGLSTAAQGTALMVFETELNQKKRPVVLLLLGSPDHENEMKGFYSWLKGNY